MSFSVKQAVELLNQGIPVGMPTETVYGLAARIDLPESIKKIFLIKKRPFFDPLIVHVSNVNQAKTLSKEWSIICDELAKKFWPGPLTLVLKKSEQVNELISSGLETVGIRHPNHPLAQQLIEEVGCPLAAPSANRFGRTSPTTAQDVLEELGDQGIQTLDGGKCSVGIESTVLSVNLVLTQKSTSQQWQLRILRPGLITKKDIDGVLQKIGNYSWADQEAGSTLSSPGQMKHHYMPAIPLILVPEHMSEKQLALYVQQRLDQIPREFEGVKLHVPRKIEKIVELKLSEQAEIAARELYANLRKLAATKADIIYFRLFKSYQLDVWQALRDRLEKAASLKFTD